MFEVNEKNPPFSSVSFVWLITERAILTFITQIQVLALGMKLLLKRICQLSQICIVSRIQYLRFQDIMQPPANKHLSQRENQKQQTLVIPATLLLTCFYLCVRFYVSRTLSNVYDGAKSSIMFDRVPNMPL